MGRPPKIESPGTPEYELAQRDREADVLGQIKGLFDQTGSGDVAVSASVYRLIPQAGKSLRESRMRWMFDCEWTDLESLRPKLQGEPYGAGAFRVQVRHNGRHFAQYDLEIEALPKPIVPPAPPAPDTSKLDAHMDRMERMFEMMIGRLAAVPAPAPAPAPIGPSVKETIETFAALQGLMPKVEPNIGLSMFEKGMELALKVAGNGGESNLIDLVKDALHSPALAQLAQGAIQQMTPRAPQMAPPMQPMPMPMPMPAPPPRASTNDALRKLDETRHTIANAKLAERLAVPDVAEQLDRAINFLLGKAAEGAQPDLFVDWVLEKLPPMAFEALEQQPDPLAYLESLYPEIGRYRPWFGALIEALYEPAPNEQVSPPQGGDHDVRLQ